MSTLLNGGVEIEVILENGTKEMILVRQLPVREYEAAFPKFDSEVDITATIIGKPKSYLVGLSPESYEVIAAKAKEVNEKGFFAFAERQKRALIKSLNEMNPELMQLAAQNLSKSSPLGLRPLQG